MIAVSAAVMRYVRVRAVIFAGRFETLDSQKEAVRRKSGRVAGHVALMSVNRENDRE